MATAPFFRVADPDALAQWLSHGVRLPWKGNATISPLEREMLEAWETLSEGRKEPFDFAELHEVMDRQAGKTRTAYSLSRSLSGPLNLLAEAGVIWRERATMMGPGMGRSFIYHLQLPANVAANWKGGPTESQDNTAALYRRKTPKEPKPSISAEQTHALLKALGWFDERGVSVASKKSLPDDAWTLHLISQLIERCSRSSSQVQLETISSHIKINGEMIEVEAGRVKYEWESSVEYGLIAAGDSQLILAILTMAMQSIARDIKAGTRPPRNRVSFDLLELSEMLHPGGGKAAYRSFQRGMARIINTVYRLRPVGNTTANRVSFSLIESVTEGADNDEGVAVDDAQSAWVPQDAGMRYFSFSLNSHIWNGLLRGQGWLVHPELIYERSGLIHRVYHHLRSHAGLDEPYEVRADNLAKWLVSGLGSNPTRSRQRFREDLKEQLQRRAQRTQPVFSMLGGRQEEEGEIEFRLFDLDIKMRPCPKNASNYTISAKQSRETLELLQRQDEKLREMAAGNSDGGVLE